MVAASAVVAKRMLRAVEVTTSYSRRASSAAAALADLPLTTSRGSSELEVAKPRVRRALVQRKKATRPRSTRRKGLVVEVVTVAACHRDRGAVKAAIAYCTPLQQLRCQLATRRCCRRIAVQTPILEGESRHAAPLELRTVRTPAYQKRAYRGTPVAA